MVATKSATKSTHPKFADMITEAIVNIKDRKGVSRPAIHKYVTSTFKVDGNVAKKQIKLALKRGTDAGAFVQDGQRFRATPKTKTAAKKSSTDKLSAKKAVTKKPTAKKPVAKKPVAKKAVAKKPAAKSAKAIVAKKKNAAKSKISKKPAAKKPLTKKPAAKKATKPKSK